ncbi:response regulator [Kineococcus sp. R86509]|uniref:response regulator n=1 Tax=Kineococcus sp. R86509 TaxID=3093851 RepID=UPI0036D35657
MTTVLVVDDQDDMRAGIRAMLAHDPGLQVVADLSDGLQAVTFLREHPVDVVLMDLRMPGVDGVEATRRIRLHHPPEEVRVVVLTTFDQDDVVLAALRAGANGFLSKMVGPEELVAGIAEVVGGGGTLSAAATSALIHHVAHRPQQEPDRHLLDRFAVLTPRERDITLLVADGLSNQEIAARLSLSPFTVKTHAVRVMTKVGARDRAQLVSFAFRAGLRP